MKAPLFALLRRRLRQPVRRRVNIRCQLETLESRRLLAADLATWYSANPAGGEALVGPVQMLVLDGPADSAMFFSVADNAEGEAADDLVAFAQALTAAGVKFYGADWCPFCTDQKVLFQDGARYLDIIEVTNPDRTLNDIGLAEEITTFPTWHFPDETRATGVLSLAEISQRSGVPIPTGEVPSFFPLGDTTLTAGSPIFLPIDAYDPNGGPLTITAVSSNPDVVSTEVTQDNRSLRITVRNYGDMVFELFEDKVPRPTGRIIELVESGFYDAETHDEPIIFHRVIEDFVLQAGDPTRTGLGGSTLGKFDDQFHVDLQHSQAGVLSFAKAADDTNDSQFFITAGPERALDFNHSVFGQLIEGDSVRQGIDRVPTDGDDRPIRDVEIVSMSIELDEENGLVMLKAPHGVTGESDVTITVTDTDGNSVSETIRVTVVADTFNSAPFLDNIPPLSTTVNTPLTFQLSAQDVEGDPFYFDAVLGTGSETFEFDIQHDTGVVSVTPPQDFIGKLQLLVGVRGAEPTDSVDQFDTQLLNIEVAPTAPNSVELLPEYDSGQSDSDQITNRKQLGVRVDGLISNAFVSVLVGNVVVGQVIASGASMVIDTDLSAFPDGVHAITATQQVAGSTSARSASLEVTLDTTAPVFTSIPPAEAVVGEAYTYEAETSGEQEGAVTYSLTGAPIGVSVEPNTGVVSWIPTAAQRGSFSFTLVATDVAGNSSQQSVAIAVMGEEILRYRLSTTRLDGTAADSFAIGEEFYLQVYVADMRVDAQGVYAAYLDVLFTNQLVVTAGPLEFGEQFPGDRAGQLDDPTRINDAGAIAELEETGGDEFLLFEIRMRAILGGEELIQSSFADNSPLRDSFVLGTTEPLAENEMGFGSVTIQIATPFTAVDDLFNIDEDTSALFDVLANDLYPGGDVTQLRVLEVGTPDQGGEVSIEEDGRIRYQPAPDFLGVETFTYTITDDEHGTSTATVTVQVHPVNDPPTANDDTFTGENGVTRGSTNNILDLLANDSFAPDVGEVLRIISVGPTSHGGVVTIAPNGTHVLYTPAANFTGMETFEYTITDGNGGIDTATVAVEVREVIPGQIGGYVYLDRNGNGQRDGSEHPVVGVEVKLQGTDDLGQTMQRTTVTGREGKYLFTDLPPGTYTITETRPSLFAAGSPATDSGSDASALPSLVVNLAEGAQVMNSNFAELGPAAPHISIRDLFASNHSQSVLLVVNGTTHQVISSGSESWQSVQITSARVSANQSHWEFTAQDAEQNQLVATLANQQSRDLQIMGGSGGETLIRLYGTPDSLQFVPTTNSASFTELGSASIAPSQQSASGDVEENVEEHSSANSEAEGEGGAEAVSHAEIFAASSGEAWNDGLETEVLEALASQETLKPKAVQSALLSMMFASSSR